MRHDARNTSSRLVTSVLAARASSSAVLAFKAAVDELSRLACARAQDETLLHQLENQLSGLDPAVGARLLTECRFRDEWRDEQVARALSSLPSSEQDPEMVQRMQEYVALLAPDEPEDVSGHFHMQGQQEDEWSWQNELLRQQRALASLLTLCSGHASSDKVAGVLADFMDHSRVRLHEQLLNVHHQLVQISTLTPAARAGAKQQQQQQQQQAQQQQQQPPPNGTARHAWGDPADDAAANEDQQLGGATAGGEPKPEGFRGLSADEFVEQLRGKHRAVCSIQASVRGRIQRSSFQRLMKQRLGAVMRMQCAARQREARQAVEKERHLRWLDACRTMARRHSARRIQRAWRWVQKKRQWKATWLAKEAKRVKKEDRRWRNAIHASLLPRAPDATGFSQFSVYTESKTLAAKRESEEQGATKLQGVSRSLLARLKLRNEAAAATVLQGGVRRWRARTLKCWWRRELRVLHSKRRARMRWRAARATALALQPLQTHAVLVHLNVSKELARVQSEAGREKADFETSFKKWAGRMERQTLAKKLHADWIPQMNVEEGQTYYFNVRTGESSEEHPNMRQVRATEKKQRGIGEAQILERLTRLKEYEEQLRGGEEAQLEQYVVHAAKALSDASALRLPAANARWVQQ